MSRKRRDPPGPLNAFVSAEVVRLRKLKGLSQEALGHLIGHTQGQICHLERGQRYWEVGTTLPRVAQCLGTTASNIMRSAEAALKESLMSSIVLDQGTYEPTIVFGGDLIGSVDILETFHYFRLGDRVSFAGKIGVNWSETGAGNLQIPLPIQTLFNCALVPVLFQTGESGPTTRVIDTQPAGNPPYLYVDLVSEVGVATTILNIQASYLVVVETP